VNPGCRSLLALLIGIGLVAPGCASPGEASSESRTVGRVNELYMAEQFDDAIRVAEPLMQSSTPEVVFSVGHLYLARAQSKGRSDDERTSDSRKFVQFVEKAALLGLDDASRLLEAVFRFGGYGAVPVDSARADCWQKVINRKVAARDCARQEN
jgi:hypothetical protein